MTDTDTIALGIDTGGTFTDAVLFSSSAGVLAKAKALTTRHDLAIGIAGAIDAVLLRRPDAAGAMSHLDDLGDLDRAFVGEDRAALGHRDRLVDG